MEKSCNKLLETFDTNVLDVENKFTQLAYYSLAQKYKNKPNDNTIFKLIRNHYDTETQQKRPIINYLGGPYVFRQLYNKKYNINIYLFGERHSNTTDCSRDFVLVENYFKQIIETTDVFLDIYFEFPGFIKNYYSSINVMAPQRMQELFLKFYKCVETLSRKSEECQLSRMHFIDIRSFISSDYGINSISWLIKNLLFYSHDSNQLSIFYKSNIKQITKIFSYLDSNNEREYTDYIISQILTNKYVKKELDKSFLGEQIYEYVRNIIISQALLRRNNIRTDISRIRNNIGSLKSNYQNLKNELIVVNSVIVEAYTLSRIFKRFSVKNKTSQPVTPHNIIHYAGSAHTLKIENFLKLVGFEVKQKVGSNIDSPETSVADIYENCINMTKVKQPLF